MSDGFYDAIVSMGPFLCNRMLDIGIFASKSWGTICLWQLHGDNSIFFSRIPISKAEYEVGHLRMSSGYEQYNVHCHLNQKHIGYLNPHRELI